MTFAGTYTEFGTYFSDPSDNFFGDDLILGEQSYLLAAGGLLMPAVPEPGTGLMLLMGLACCMRRRSGA